MTTTTFLEIQYLLNVIDFIMSSLLVSGDLAIWLVQEVDNIPSSTFPMLVWHIESRVHDPEQNMKLLLQIVIDFNIIQHLGE